MSRSQGLGGFLHGAANALVGGAAAKIAAHRRIDVRVGRLRFSDRKPIADMTCPVLAFVGETDDIAPAHTVRAVSRAAPRSEVYECALPAGHFGLVVGSTSVETTWPTVAVICGPGEVPLTV